ncbi:MAG TPA: hypothetical protein VF400_16400, partial [Anaeromyxobacteraceae bacterium]
VEPGGEVPEELELNVDDNAQIKGCLAGSGCDAGLTCQSDGRCEECTASGSCSTTELWSECVVLGNTSCASALGSGGICYATSGLVGRCTVPCATNADCPTATLGMTCEPTAKVCVRPSK